MFLGSIRKKMPYEAIEILKFKMAAAAILDYLNSLNKNVLASYMMFFVCNEISLSSLYFIRQV